MTWKNKNNRFIFLIINIFLFLVLILTLNIVKKPRIMSVNGQTVFISDTKYQTSGYFAYILIFKKTQFLKFNTNKISIFLPLNNHHLTLLFPQWNNDDQLLVMKNIDANTYLNQVVLIILGTESLLSFIWNNITT